MSSHEQSSNDEQDEDDNNGDTAPSKKDRDSIDGQIDELQKIKTAKNLKLAHEPIIDEGKTGRNFDREGIQKAFKIAQRDEVKYFLVEKVDRIGRSAAETLYFIHILQTECNVTLLTPSGEHDVGKIEGLMQTTLLSLMAEIQNEIRTGKATKERVTNFVQSKEWKSYASIIPVGYDEKDDWPEPNPEERKVVEDLFDRFTNPKYKSSNNPDEASYANYSATERAIESEHGAVLDGHRVKSLLKDPVYIGKPQVPESWVSDLPYDNVVDDPNLQLIDEDMFNKAQELIEKKDKKHSTDDETNDLVDFIEEFDLFTVLLSSEPATLLHDCGEPMVKNGQRDIADNWATHLYHCPKCDMNRTWPKKFEYYRMEVIHELLDEEKDYLEAIKSAISIFKQQKG